MKLSVALCTYNGANYIREQLESILSQIIPVDEIVICDDGSTDDTIEIIEKVLKNTKIKIIFQQNDKNIGLINNFAKAVSLCTGDIIFLSDQDDVWLPQKTQCITSHFKHNPGIDLISTDAYLFNEKGQSYNGDSLWEHTHIDCWNYIKENNLVPDFFVASGRVTGATVAFRNIEPYSTFINYQGDFKYHDETITFLAIIANRYMPIPDKLMRYRISSTQNCGLNPYYLDRDFFVPYPSVYKFNSLPLNDQWKERVKFIEKRLAFKKKPWKILFHIKKYICCYGSFAMKFIISDIRNTFRGVLNKLHLFDSDNWKYDFQKLKFLNTRHMDE